MKRILKLVVCVALIMVLAPVFYYLYVLYHVDLPETFELNLANSSLNSSIGKFTGKYQAEIEPVDLRFPDHVKIRFIRNDLQVLCLNGYTETVFCVDGDTLYFADFLSSSSGCAIEAYNLAWGWRMWRTDLRCMDEPVNHTRYNNQVSLTLSDQTLMIAGSESFGDYVEILDRRTGISMAHKVYRKGFFAPKEGEPPFIGGPIR